MVESLRELIEHHCTLGREMPSGFLPIECAICKDHSARAGFKFEENSVVYNCFNCKYKCIFDCSTSIIPSNKFLKLLDAFHIPEDQYRRIFFNARTNATGSKNKVFDNFVKSSRHENIPHVIEVEMPNTVEKLDCRSEKKQHRCAIDYLRSRGIRVHDYDFHVGVFGQWNHRIVIPVYNRQHKLVFYQGRYCGPTTEKKIVKYLSCSGVKASDIIYNYDALFKNTTQPLIVTEGWFDAFAVDGVCVFGNKISDRQRSIIEQTKRKIIFVPDRYGNGRPPAEQSIDYGWSISSFYGLEPELKDINDVYIKYGKLYTMKKLFDNAKHGSEAKAMAAVYCK